MDNDELYEVVRCLKSAYSANDWEEVEHVISEIERRICESDWSDTNND